MSETSFSVKGNGVGKVRLESTDIIGIGSPANSQLIIGVKFQLLPMGQNRTPYCEFTARFSSGIEEFSPLRQPSTHLSLKSLTRTSMSETFN